MGMEVIRAMTPRVRSLSTEFGCAYHARIVTNGLLLTPGMARELEGDYGVTTAEVTLDGTEAVHDTRRVWKNGRPSFRKIFSNLVAIARCDDITMKIIVRCNVDRTNADNVDALIDLLAEEALNERVTFYTAPIHNWGNDADRGSLGPAEYASLEIGWLRRMLHLGFRPALIPDQKPIVCIAVQPDSELIDADGNLFNCTEVSYVPAYGRPNRFAIGHADGRVGPGRRNLLADFNRRIEQGAVPCTDCRMLPVCGGSCPKLWLEGVVPCPSPKYNITERLLLELEDEFGHDHDAAQRIRASQ
jgi:uncharacterized protein